jgi:hypothetical protein
VDNLQVELARWRKKVVAAVDKERITKRIFETES